MGFTFRIFVVATRSPVTPRKYSSDGMVQRNEAGVRRLPLSGSTMQHCVRKVSALPGHQGEVGRPLNPGDDDKPRRRTFKVHSL